MSKISGILCCLHSHEAISGKCRSVAWCPSKCERVYSCRSEGNNKHSYKALVYVNNILSNDNTDYKKFSQIVTRLQLKVLFK